MNRAEMRVVEREKSQFTGWLFSCSKKKKTTQKKLFWVLPATKGVKTRAALRG